MSLHSEFARFAATHTLPADVAIGLSGGADSLALVHTALHHGCHVHAIVVDHQLQADSASVARAAADRARALGATAEIRTVTVAGDGEGPARHARYLALGHAAAGRPLLVAHTASDAAEGLLLGLTRGSGLDSLAGMPSVTTDHPAVDAGAAWLGRPLLRCSRTETQDHCRRAGLEWWDDPHNADPRFTRSRIRTDLIPQMRNALGEHITDNMARTTRLLRDDADALDTVATTALTGLTEVASNNKEAPALGEKTALNCAKLSQHPAAIRRRIYQRWLADIAGELTSTHLLGIDALVERWKGQGGVAIPWGQQCPTMNEKRHTHRLVVRRKDGQLQLAAVAAVAKDNRAKLSSQLREEERDH
ncbi:tRNA lysidine(34) synthetase TilS [Corynebacterium falsenii]